MAVSPFDFACGEFSASQVWGLSQTAASLQKGLQTSEAASTTSVWIIKQPSPRQTRTSALNASHYATAPACAALKLNRTSCAKSRINVNTALQPDLTHLKSNKNRLLLLRRVWISHITPTGYPQSASLCLSWHANSTSAARSNCMQWCASILLKCSLEATAYSAMQPLRWFPVLCV